MPTLYHFTSHPWFHWVATEGITRGDCPVNETTELKFPNLTTDPDPSRQGWSLNPGCANKTAVRITVEVPDGDGRLVAWRRLTEQYKMGREYYRRLDMSGGFGALNWHVYRGIVVPEWFTSVDILAQPDEVESAYIEDMKEFKSFAEYDAAYGRRGPHGMKIFLPGPHALAAVVAGAGR